MATRGAKVLFKIFECGCEHPADDVELIRNNRPGARQTCRQHGATRSGAIMECFECHEPFRVPKKSSGRALYCQDCARSRKEAKAKRSASLRKKRQIIGPDAIAYIKAHPEVTQAELARKFGVDRRTIYRAFKKYGLRRPTRPGRPAKPITDEAPPEHKPRPKTIVSRFIDRAADRILLQEAERSRRAFAGRVRIVEIALKSNPELRVSADRDIEKLSKSASRLSRIR